MLNLLKRYSIREALILVFFAGFLHEVLLKTTLALVLAGAVLTGLKKRPSKLVRNLLALGIFAAYWMIYGRIIDPEVGLNFLTSIIVLKLLEKETERDRYMVFFGIILLISAGTLFVKDLIYVVFFGMSFFLLIVDFYRSLKLPFSWRETLTSLGWVLPLTIFLFFFTPRIMDPFQLDRGSPSQGEVGYTTEVDLNQIERLTGSGKSVFTAQVEQQIPTEKLYWRGNTISDSDGWNWTLRGEDRTIPPSSLEQTPVTGGIKQSIRVLSKQPFFFGLDHPETFITKKGQALLSSVRTMPQSPWRPLQRYEVLSLDKKIIAEEANQKSFLLTGLSSRSKSWIQEHFRSSNLLNLQSEIEYHFQQEGFVYSLAPGKITSFLDFMETKKIGFCSHYASAVAHILRVKGVPARLVTGFMGGAYNKFSSFYLITQNDAHVWVEAYHQGSWVRLDPTSWIAPDRVRLGGDAFVQQSASEGSRGVRFLRGKFKFIDDLGQLFDHWNYSFFRILEEMDYYGQMAWLEKINFKAEWLYSLIPLVLALFMGLYTWNLSRKDLKPSELELLWNEFRRKLEKRGLNLHLGSIEEGERLLLESRLKEKETLVSVWRDLVGVSFNPDTPVNRRELKRRVQKL